MKVIIVEDEIAASENLTYLLNQIDADIEIISVLDSVKSAVAFFKKPTNADFVLMDIHLADGISFEIFEQVKLPYPVIFTTAYDQYALQAFKVNSIDYLLKPIDEDELRAAINKFENSANTSTTSDAQIEGLLSLLQSQKRSYKSTYLVQYRDELRPLKVEDIAFLYIDTGIVKAVTIQNQTYIIDSKLEDIEAELDPVKFFRANRQFIVQKKSIENIKYYFNGKLIVSVSPPFSDRIVVSKAKSSSFKKWMDS